MDQLPEQIEELAKPFFEETQLDLVDLHIRHQGRDITIEILADRADGGITVEECTQLNKQISCALEQENLISGRYALEVSSPGLDRPLKTRKDFARVIGRAIRVFLSEPVGEKIEHAGILQAAQEENILLDCEGKMIKIPIYTINKGKQII
ncbi:MAG: ribosome maturation factor RimP [Candidatus Omnitrophota bacterium]